jgi:hypothetical protein
LVGLPNVTSGIRVFISQLANALTNRSLALRAALF